MKSIATRLTNKLSVLMLPCVITILLSSCGSKPLAFEANDNKSNTPEASSVPSELIGKWSDKNDENFINKAYESIATATEEKNVNQMFAYASPEYKSTDTNGKVKNLQENVQKESAGFQKLITKLGSFTIKDTFKIEPIKSDEQNVVVLVNEKVNVSTSSQNNFITAEGKRQDTWVRTSNGLKMIASQDISSNVISAKPNLQTNQANQAQVSDNQSSTPEASSAPSEIIGNWSNKNDENFINKAYESIATATEQKNVNQMFAYASSEYKSTDNSGQIRNLQESVQKESAGFQEINMLGSSTIKDTFKIESIKSDEQNVVVLVNEKVNLSISSQSNPITAEGKHQDTWVRTSNGLKMIASQDISSNGILAKPNPQTNQTNQAQVSDNKSDDKIMDFFGMTVTTRGLMRSCYSVKNMEDCRKIEKILSFVSDSCNRGSSRACQAATIIREQKRSSDMLDTIDGISKP